MLRKLGVILKKMFFAVTLRRTDLCLRQRYVKIWFGERGEGIYVSVIFTNELLKKNLKDKIRHAYEQYCSRLQI